MIFNLAGKNIQHNLFNTERKAEFASMTWFADFISVGPCQWYLPPNFTIILVIWILELLSEPSITKKTWKPAPLSAKLCDKQSVQTSGLHVSVNLWSIALQNTKNAQQSLWDYFKQKSQAEHLFPSSLGDSVYAQADFEK